LFAVVVPGETIMVPPIVTPPEAGVNIPVPWRVLAEPLVIEGAEKVPPPSWIVPLFVTAFVAAKFLPLSTSRLPEFVVRVCSRIVAEGPEVMLEVEPSRITVVPEAIVVIEWLVFVNVSVPPLAASQVPPVSVFPEKFESVAELVPKVIEPPIASTEPEFETTSVDVAPMLIKPAVASIVPALVKVNPELLAP
jgi:hypothetical protein